MIPDTHDPQTPLQKGMGAYVLKYYNYFKIHCIWKDCHSMLSVSLNDFYKSLVITTSTFAIFPGYMLNMRWRVYVAIPPKIVSPILSEFATVQLKIHDGRRYVSILGIWKCALLESNDRSWRERISGIQKQADILRQKWTERSWRH